MRNAVDPTMRRLLADVAAGIRVLQTRDGIDLSELQIRERARNIVMGLISNYRIEVFEDELEDAPSEADSARSPFLDHARISSVG